MTVSKTYVGISDRCFTDCGSASLRRKSPTRALFRDVDSNTYELPDFNRLDATSRRYLQRYF